MQNHPARIQLTSFCEWYCCIIHSYISSFRGKLTKQIEVYTQNLAPSWPELVSHRNPSLNDIISPPTKHSSVYICVILHMFQLPAICVWLPISWLLWPCKTTVVFLWRDIQEFAKKLYVTPIPTWKLNRVETPSASDYIVTMISIALPISFWRRELRYQNRTEELPRSSVFFVHQFTAVLSNSITNSGIT